jgi:hypothetical protein
MIWQTEVSKGRRKEWADGRDEWWSEWSFLSKSPLPRAPDTVFSD